IRDFHVTGVQTCALPIYLQLRIEQIDTAHLASLDPERLAHYNQVLREQLAELDEEVARLCAPFELVGSAGRGVTPADADRSIDRSEERRVGKEGRSRWRR